MARLARGCGSWGRTSRDPERNRRQQTFFSDDDYAHYRGILAESCREAGVKIGAYELACRERKSQVGPGGSRGEWMGKD